MGALSTALEQRGQECCQLIAGVLELLHLAQVNRQLVEQNQCRLTTEQLAQGLGTRSDAAFVALAHPRIPILASKCISDLTPGGVSEKTCFHPPPIGRICVLAVEGRDTDVALRQKGGIDKLRDTRHTLHAACGMAQRDQPVGFTAAVGGVEPENRRDFTTRTHQPPAHVGEQVLKAPRGIGVGEETGRIKIFDIAHPDDDLSQVRRKVGLRNRSLENIRAWPACLEYLWNGHCSRSTGSPMLSGPTAFPAVHWSISLFLNRQEPPTLKPGIPLSWQPNGKTCGP